MLDPKTLSALDTVLSGSPDRLFIHDSDGRCLYASPDGLRGVSAATGPTVGKTWGELGIPSELMESLDAAGQEANVTGVACVREVRVPTDDGARYFSCTAHRIGEPESGDTAVVCALRDITGPKRAQETAGRMERLFRALMDRLPDQIYFKDREHRFTHVNSAVLANMGVEHADDLVGRTDLDFVPEGYAQDYQAQEQTLFETGEPVVGSVERYDTDDGAVWTHVTKVPTRDAAGRVDGLIGINRDVTEFVETREALMRAEARYGALFEASNVAIGFADPAGRIIDVNPALCEMLGYAREELVEMSVMDVVHLEDREDLGRRYREVATGRARGTRSESRFVRKDGSTLWADRAGAAVQDEDGDLLGLMVVLTDITERKAVEEQLLEEQRLFHALMTGIPDAIYFKDRESRFLRANEATAREHGMQDPNDLVGKTDDDLVPEDRAHVLRAEEDRLLTTGELVTNIHEPMVRADHRHGWKHVTKAPVRDADGEIVGLIGINRDITELMEAQEELRESEERFRTLAEASFEGIGISDDDGILHVNDRFAEMLGYSAAELAGKRVPDLLAPESRARVREERTHGGYGPYEHLALRKDATTFPVEIRARNTVWKGRRARVTAIRDITERREAEAELAVRASNRQALFDAMPDLIYELDGDGVIQSVHGGRDTAMYLPREELLGKAARDVAPPAVAARVLEAIHAAMATGEVQIVEYELTIGEELHTRETHFVPMQEGPVAAITRDITERKQYERRLEERVRVRTEELNRELEDRVRAEQELSRSQRERTLLLRRILSAQEEERTRIARELHDQTGQALSSLLVSLRVLEDANTLDAVRRRVGELREATGDALERVRTLSFGLRPSSVDHFGLNVALSQDVDSLGAQLGVTAEFYADSEDGYGLSEDVEIAVYRVVHGALTNIVRHAEAKSISLIMRERNRRLHVLIEDDGVGFDPEKVMAGPVEERFGLLAMEERLQSVGGGLRVESTVGEGTTIYVEVPIAESESAQ